MTDIYALSDKAVTLLNRRAIKRFEDARSRLALLAFDELSVIKEMKTLYTALDKDNREVFLDLALMVYGRTEPHGAKKPGKSWLAEFLAAYNGVTLYVYDNEVDRKREYAAESIIAAQNKAEEFQRALKYWSRFTANYTDLVADEAVIKAFSDAGVKRVMWITEGDNKVCDECDERDGEVYPIDDIPPKPHVNCRCRLVPVK